MPEPAGLPLEIDNAFSLHGEVALITGGGSGLGFGIGRAIIQAGARVVLVGRRESVLAAAVSDLGEAASYEVFDLTSSVSKENLVARVSGRMGAVSILVNNAGIHLKKRVRETTDEEFFAVFNTHVLGAFALTRAVVPGMLAGGHGSILFIASMTALFGIPLVSAYSAAKSAYLGLVRSLSCELASQGVRVNAIAPGWIDTPMLRQALDGDNERKKKILDRTPMGVFGKPQDVGWSAVYLSSRAASFITGVVLPVDGGASIGF